MVKRMGRAFAAVFAVLGLLQAGVQAFDVTRVPTSHDLEAIRQMGWEAAADRLEEDLAAAWKPAHFAQAGSSANATFRQWQLLYQWCRLLGTPEPVAVRAWLGRRTVRSPEGEGLLVVPPGFPLPADKTGRLQGFTAEELAGTRVSPEILQGLLPGDYTSQPGPVAERAKQDFLLQLAGDPEFLREFFQNLTPDDFAPMVVARLEQVRAENPGAWPAYRSLMIAFALVYDQREPASWPHHQVRRQVVPAMDETPASRFGYYYTANEARRLEYDLRRLSAAELKFVVDAPIPRSELEWAAKNVRQRRDKFDRTFSSVTYDHKRIRNSVFQWPDGPQGSYRLGNIELWGGICTDQAYFAAIAGKAKGIPTIYFAGQGLDGGHAWFGFLRNLNRWELDAGRYENQNYTVGQALDPQTWLPITDHELLYLSGKAAKSPTHEAALGDLLMADVFAGRGEAGQRNAAAASAVHHAPGLVAAWEAQERALVDGDDPGALKAFYAKAIDQFRREEDLRVRYQTRLAEWERGEGDTLAARNLEDRMIRENRRGRADLSISASAEVLTRLVDSGDYDAAMREYRSIAGKLGRSGGGNFFYEVVRPLVLRLKEAGRERDAGRVLQQARRVMSFEKDSILDREFAALESGNARPGQ